MGYPLKDKEKVADLLAPGTFVGNLFSLVSIDPDLQGN